MGTILVRQRPDCNIISGTPRCSFGPAPSRGTWINPNGKFRRASNNTCGNFKLFGTVDGVQQSICPHHPALIAACLNTLRTSNTALEFISGLMLARRGLSKSNCFDAKWHVSTVHATRKAAFAGLPGRSLARRVLQRQ